jgi:hypothetical protein
VQRVTAQTRAGARALPAEDAPRGRTLRHGSGSRAMRDWSLWLLDAGAATDAGLAGPRVRTASALLRIGGMAQIGLAVHDGQLSVVVDEVSTRARLV